MTSPVLAALAKALYGEAVEAGEFAKSVDAADVHLDGPLLVAKKRKARPGEANLAPMPVQLAQSQLAKFSTAAHTDDPRRDRRLALLGLGTTGVATAAGVHAIKATTVENAERKARALGKPTEAKPYKVPKILGRMSPKKAVLATGAAALGLHGVELVGDTLAARSQLRELKRAKQPVAKGMVKVSLKPVNPAAVRRVVSLKARNPAAAPPPIAKGLLRNVKSTAKNAEELSGKVSRLVPRPRTAAIALGATAAAVPVAAGVATYQGSKRGVRAGMGKSFDAAVAITKRDDERKQVFGWANVSVMGGQLVVDRQGDIIPIEELEKAAYDYVQDSRVGADQHRRISKWALEADLGPRKTATMIESMVFTPEKIEKMGLPGDFPQAWWVGYQIEDPEVWSDIKTGRRTGFSIHGTGRRTPMVGTVAKYVEPDSTPAVRIRRKHVGVQQRYQQAKNPPPVRRVATPSSSMMASVGYQRQTRKLDAELRTRPGDPYSSRVRPKVARRVLEAPSKGKAWNSEIRAKHAPRHDHYTPVDRARLFLSPVS